jgi:inhibitor of KinA sporulation pathway (predicted exonuclease)
MLEVELTHMERAPSAALTKIEDIYFRMTQCSDSFSVEYNLLSSLLKPLKNPLMARACKDLY